MDTRQTLVKAWDTSQSIHFLSFFFFKWRDIWRKRKNQLVQGQLIRGTLCQCFPSYTCVCVLLLYGDKLFLGVCMVIDVCVCTVVCIALVFHLQPVFSHFWFLVQTVTGCYILDVKVSCCFFSLKLMIFRAAIVLINMKSIFTMNQLVFKIHITVSLSPKWLPVVPFCPINITHHQWQMKTSNSCIDYQNSCLLIFFHSTMAGSSTAFT